MNMLKIKRKIRSIEWQIRNPIWTIKNLRWVFHDIIENFCDKHHHIANKTYEFRKWLYVWVLDLEVCRYCFCPTKDYYCDECLYEENVEDYSETE